eukprot:364388-Chlamydomonas_euryale.AAC.15
MRFAAAERLGEGGAAFCASRETRGGRSCMRFARALRTGEGVFEYVHTCMWRGDGAWAYGWMCACNALMSPNCCTASLYCFVAGVQL